MNETIDAQEISTACVGRHKEATAATTGLLCTAHYLDMHAMLQEIMESYEKLGDYMEPGSAAIDTDVRRGKRADHAAPIRLEIVALTDWRTGPAINGGDVVPVIGIVSGWARIVREERAIATDNRPATLRREATLLLAHSAWIAGQPWVDDYLSEIREAWRALQRATGIETRRPIGTCPTTLADTSDPCCGPLWADITGRLEVQCGKCGTTWTEQQITDIASASGIFN